jgi:sporadic carbohydrate cluster protein (TIGR04323 family)
MIYYVTPRKFGDFIVPIPTQSAHLRLFANNRGIPFSLPVSEVCFPHKYTALASILQRAASENKTVVMLSVYQFPFDIQIEFENFLERNHDYKKIRCITALEGLDSTIINCWEMYRDIYNPVKNICSNLEW